MARFERVAVLMGGRSAEREVSLVSGRDCAKALRETGYSVVEIDPGPDVAEKLAAARPDAVFNALHGRWGEDGTIQGLLEQMGLPYTHSGVLASALAMDKPLARTVFAAAGLPIARGVLVSLDNLRRAHPLAPPYVIKPAREGSSVGVMIVEAGANRPPQAFPPVLEAAGEALIEAFVPGAELTVSVLDGKAMTVTDILPAEGFYDYHAKYAAGGSRHVLPADVPADVFAAAMSHAETAHRALQCRGVTRADFRYDRYGNQQLVILEINTQPGMTPTSLVPEQAAHLGMSFRDLVVWIMEDASCQR